MYISLVTSEKMKDCILDRYTMGRRIVVKNFGPIKHIEMDVKAFTVLIGESGSGKSTLMKLIYCLNAIYDRIMERAIEDSLHSQSEYESSLDFLRNFEIDEFMNKKTEIKYSYKGIDIDVSQSPKASDRIEIKISKIPRICTQRQIFIADLRAIIPEILNNRIDRGIRPPFLLNDTFRHFSKSISSDKDSYKLHLFGVKLVKSREGGMVDKFFVESEDYKISYENTSSGVKAASIVEIISSYYSKQSKEEIKNYMEQWLPLGIGDEIKRNLLGSVEDFQTTIFIEEPELSLFPKHQKGIIELILGSFLKCEESSAGRLNFILSTHSPFILSSLSNIMMAARVWKKKKKKLDVKRIPENFLKLDTNEVGVYKIEKGKAKSILDEEDGYISTEYLDSIADTISQDYEDLSNLGI